jgi:phage terminase large subunit GpA-like protein
MWIDLDTPLDTSDRTTAARILAGAARIWEPPPQRTADQWADDCRVLPPGSPEPGPWRTDRVPYTREIYRAFSDPRFETVIVVMGAQMSKTELVLNVIGHRFTDGPYTPTLYIGPTEKQVRSMSKDRVMKMIRATPELWDRLAKGQHNKIAEKWIAGIRLGFAWAGSATELASHPAGLVLVDERDRMDSDVGGEGDPVELARARGSNYWDFKLGVVSTPTLEGASPIWSLYEQGTMMKWAWPCQHCAEYFVPRLELLRFDDSGDLAKVRSTAIVACPNCGGEHENRHKQRLNAAGIYLPHRLNAKGEHEQIEEPIESSTASFWADGLVSPWRSFGQRAERLVEAYRSHDPGKIQAVINTGFGELFKARGDAPPWEAVLETRSHVARGVVPDWSRLVTMGVDVQKKRPVLRRPRVGLQQPIAPGRSWIYSRRHRVRRRVDPVAIGAGPEDQRAPDHPRRVHRLGLPARRRSVPTARAQGLRGVPPDRRPRVPEQGPRHPGETDPRRQDRRDRVGQDHQGRADPLAHRHRPYQNLGARPDLDPRGRRAPVDHA